MFGGQGCRSDFAITGKSVVKVIGLTLTLRGGFLLFYDYLQTPTRSDWPLLCGLKWLILYHNWSCVSIIRSGANNHVPPDPAASDAVGHSLSDISEYLKDIPLDWLSDAANLLNHTLQFNCLTLSNGSMAGVDDGEVSAIVRGAKQVRVPPG